MERDAFVFPASFSQERLWFLDQLEPGTSTFNMVRVIHLAGPLNTTALEQSFNEVVRRHAVLRTTFSVMDGQPMQVIAPRLTLTVPIVELQGLPKAERQREALRLAKEEAQQPFDLVQGPLIRATLLRLQENDHILLLVMHHIISDGWSMGILFREISSLYQSFSAGAPSSVPELPIQYADYAWWQRKQFEEDRMEGQLAYWRQQLAGAPEVLDLPTDHPRPHAQTYLGGRQYEVLPSTLTEALSSLSRQEGTTLFMTLLAAFQTLLHRYTGQTDIVVGSPVAHRTQASVESLIGFFVNTLALRTDLSGNPTFRELLGRVRTVCLDAYAHQDLPFEKLVKELQPLRDPSRSPLFQTMLVLQNTPEQALQLPAISGSPIEIELGVAQFDLSLILEEMGDGFRAKAVYNTDLFEAATARRMLGHFLTLLQGIVADPDQPIAELPLLTDVEQHRLLVAWNDTGVNYRLDLCLHELFGRQVERTPDSIALAFEEQQLTYRELNRRANRLAHYLQSLGAGPEVLVGLCMKRSVEWVVALLGILKAGAAFVPMDPAYPDERLALMLESAKPPLVLTSEEVQDRLSGSKGRIVCLDKEESSIARESERNPESAVTPKNLAYAIFTSGSTGSPKGVMIEHKGLVNLTLAQIDAYAVRPGTRFLQSFALGSDASIAQITRPLCAGATLQLAPERSILPGPDMIRLLLDTGVTHLNLPPSLLQLLPTQELPEVKVVIVGGEACSADLVARWAPGRRFFNAYGPTEATVGSTLHECAADGQPPPIGRPIANKQIFILDEHLQPVPVGVPGELYVAGTGLARGYWDRPGLTAESFIPNPFSSRPGARMYRTGDLAKYLPDGRVVFMGRLDHQVKVRGFRIELGEIEATLGLHPGVRETVLLRWETARGDGRLAAYVVPKDGETPKARDLRRYLQEKLPDYMVPAAFVMLRALPLTPNGKVDRHALPEPNWSRNEFDQAYVAPRTPIEEVLANIYIEILSIEKVGVHDSFFELGGHSLLATQAISRMRDALQLEIPLQRLFESPTIAGMASFIEGQTNRAAMEQLRQIMAEVDQLSDEQVERFLLEEGG